MSISTSKPFDQAIADSKDAGLGPSPSSSTTSPQSNSASAMIRPPSVVQVNDDIFKHYQTHEWMRDFKPAGPVTTSLQISSPPVVEKSDRVSTKTAELPSVAREEILPRPKALYETYKVIGRPSDKGEITISVCIGKLPTEIAPDERCLPQIFDVMNRFTAQKPYPCDPFRTLDIGDAIVFRPNHDGTHSGRQVRLLETLLDCLAAHGSQSVKEILEGLVTSEKLLLKLGAYSLRIGRVDETNTHARNSDTDGWKKRSAQIFQLYAAQLPAEMAPKAQVDWVASLISVACNPVELLPKEITEDHKSNVGVQLLACVHELDLYRCYTKADMEKPIEKVKTFLFTQTEDFEKAIAFYPRLEKYALDLIQATGCAIAYYKQGYRLAEFGANSLDAKYCWQTTGSVEKPSW
jgi:hypothetical protein